MARRLTRLFAFCVLLTTLSTGLIPKHAWANTYPDRPIKLIVPFTPGGTTDLLGRLLAQKLTDKLGQPVVVENRPGAGSMIGTAATAKASPDGHTILLATSSSLVVAPVFQDASYDPVSDFTPISIIAASPFAMFVKAGAEYTSTAELIDYAKKNPGELNMASFGTGSSSHLTGELFKATANIDMVHVPYAGSAPAITDLLGGQVDLMFDMVSAALPHHKAGTVNILGVTGTERSSLLPDVPAVIETLPEFSSSAWFGIVAPAHVPESIVTRLNNELVTALDDAEVRTLLLSHSLEPVGSTADAFAATIRDDLLKWGAVVKQANVQP